MMTLSAHSKRLKIAMLGRFVVEYGDTCLSESCGRSRKIWELFKFLLVHHVRVMLPEAIAEQLWPEQPYENAKSAVRTIIHRLRSLLGEGGGCLKFIQGGYTLSLQQDVWLDITVFENACRQARQMAKQGLTQEAVSLYRQGLSLYSGDLLPECPYSDWLLPFRSHYHGLYVQSVTELTALLETQLAYAEIEDEVTKALLVDYYDETLHLILLKALLHAGKTTQAKGHYENVTSVFYREMGLKPSPALKGILRLIQGREPENGAASELAAFMEAAQCRDQAKGALLCERDVFNVICGLESRRAERTGHMGQLAVFAVAHAGFCGHTSPEGVDGASSFLEILQAALRKGDVLCRDGLEQFLVLLPATSYEQGQGIIQRLDLAAKARGLLLRRRVQPLSVSL